MFDLKRNKTTLVRRENLLLFIPPRVTFLVFLTPTLSPPVFLS